MARKDERIQHERVKPDAPENVSFILARVGMFCRTKRGWYCCRVSRGMDTIRGLNFMVKDVVVVVLIVKLMMILSEREVQPRSLRDVSFVIWRSLHSSSYIRTTHAIGNIRKYQYHLVQHNIRHVYDMASHGTHKDFSPNS